MGIVFENIWVLLTVAGLALLVVSVIRQAKPEWGYWLLLIPLAIVGLAFGLDAMIQTDAEAIGEIFTTCKKAAVNNDVETLMSFVSPDYTDGSNRTKASLKNEVSRQLNRLVIEKVKTQAHKLTIDSNTAHSELKVVVHLDSSQSEVGSLVFVGLELDYEKIGDKWYIRSADVVSVNNQP
jgi:hypothetical protein